EIMIGEDRVDQITMPGYGSGGSTDYRHDPLSTAETDLRVSTPGRIHEFRSNSQVLPVGYETRLDRLSRIAFTPGKAHKQFWSIVMNGDPTLYQTFDFTNPGWTMFTLTANAT